MATKPRTRKKLEIRKKVQWRARRAEQRLRRFKRRTFGDEGVALSLDMEADSRTLLVTFGGVKSLAGIASFEFANMTRDFAVKRLFVRDPRQSWYHRGLPRHSATLADLATSLRALIADHEVERLVVAGNSAGGYAALLFGTLLDANVVVAFAPQTVIDPAALAEINDHRWDYLLDPLVRAGALEERWVDLGKALPEARSGPTRYQVYYDETLAQERLHAERLVGLDGLRLYRFGRGGHGLVRALRDCGALERILCRALEIEQPSGGHAPGRDAGAPEAPTEKQPTLSFRTYR